MKSILKTAFVNAFGTALYIIVVASFLSYAGKMKLGGEHTPFVPIFMLMLLVLSVSITGFLIFGRPAMWYIDGKKKEALALLGYTLFTLFILLLFALGLLFVLGNR